jgi:plastocyanin
MTRLGAGLLAAAFLVSACAAGAGRGGAGSSPVPTDHVDLPKSYEFEPAAIQVAAGTTVTWTNDDNFTHSVELEGQASPVGVMKPGESATHTFTTPGSYPYICTFHPQDMRGVVEVVAG